MSAFGGKADITIWPRHVRLWPKADILNRVATESDRIFLILIVAAVAPWFSHRICRHLPKQTSSTLSQAPN